jgi:DNA-directed RNA polymerase subunit RPC12/RpoP
MSFYFYVCRSCKRTFKDEQICKAFVTCPHCGGKP